jgi:hypothetical protein
MIKAFLLAHSRRQSATKFSKNATDYFTVIC